MTIDRSLHRHLLGVFLLAAGCGQAYSDYRNEESELFCELELACGAESSVYCGAPHISYEKDECSRFHPSKANQCLEQMEEILDAIEQGQTDLCEPPRAWLDIEVCDEVTSDKNTPKCNADQIVTGRPLQHEGRWLLPAVTTGDAWAEGALAELRTERSPATQAAARHWLRVARTEHASVAAFARASLELMAVGAPPHLLEGCHRAALDEIRHARMALDVARALGDDTWDLGAVGAVPSRPASLRQVALDALLEGCIGEGGAAAAAHLAAARVEGPLAEVLRRIAVDETQHAALAWATLRWALQRDASLGPVLLQALRRAKVERRQRLAAASPAEPVLASQELDLASLGVVAPAEALRVELDVIEGIVEPVLARLLERESVEDRHGDDPRLHT